MDVNFLFPIFAFMCLNGIGVTGYLFEVLNFFSRTNSFFVDGFFGTIGRTSDFHIKIAVFDPRTKELVKCISFLTYGSVGPSSSRVSLTHGTKYAIIRKIYFKGKERLHLPVFAIPIALWIVLRRIVPIDG